MPVLSSRSADVQRTADSIFKIIQFLMFRVPADQRQRFMSRVRGKLIRISPAEIGAKTMPATSSIGQSISFVKNLLFGLDPLFIKSVISELSKLLPSNVRTAALPTVIEFDDAMINNRYMAKKPEVGRLLGAISAACDCHVFDPMFEHYLRLWQFTNEIEPTGVLDDETLARIKARTVFGNFPRNFGVVVPDCLFRGGLIDSKEQLLDMKEKLLLERVISLVDDCVHDKLWCDELGIEHVLATLNNGSKTDAGWQKLNDLDLLGKTTYVHCHRGADRTGGVIAGFRTKVCGWPCDLAYFEAKAYGFLDRYLDIIDNFSSTCHCDIAHKHPPIDTVKVRKIMSDQLFEQNLIEPAPNDLQVNNENMGYGSGGAAISNPYGIFSIQVPNEGGGK